MKSRLIRILITVVVFAALIYFALKNMSEFPSLELRSLWFIGPLVVLYLLLLTLNGMVPLVLLRVFGIELKTREWFGLAVITSIGNYLAPGPGGATARALYLKKKHNFSYTNFVITLAGVFLLFMIVASMLAVSSMLWLVATRGIFNLPVFMGALAVFVSLVLLAVINPKIPPTKYALINKIAEVMSGWGVVRAKKELVAKILLIGLLMQIVQLFIFFLEFKIFGIDLSLSGALFLSVSASLSVLVNLTPGSIGFREGLIVFSGAILGIHPAEALAISLFDRMIFISILLVLGPIFTYTLTKGNDAKTSQTS